MLVDAHAGGSGRWKEYVIVGNPSSLSCRLDVFNISPDEFLAAISNWAGADDRRYGNYRPTHHGLLEIVSIIFRESLCLLLKNQKLLVGPRLESFQPLLNVG